MPSEGPDTEKPGLNGTGKKIQARTVPAPASTNSPTNKPAPSTGKKKGKSKGSASRIGGTAVPGAKSTLAKQVPPTKDQAQQQAEYSNRTMRRRMEQLGTGPATTEERGQTLQERRKKQIERRKEKLEERREQLRKSMPGGKLTLGRRNTYFLIAVVAAIVVLIVVFLLLRQFHVIG